MWDLDLYTRLDLADAWAFISPVNWYAPTSNLKLMFDRLVCASGGNPNEKLIEHKNPELAMKLEKSPEWKALSQNHLEGRTAGFFCYGDGGGNEVDLSGRPKKLRHPHYFEPGLEPFENGRDAYAPLVWQYRYSGIEVPDELWAYHEFGIGKPYSENQAEDMMEEFDVLKCFDEWTKRFATFVTEKGKVNPGEFPAAGYKSRAHRWADIKLLWRDYRMRVGKAVKGSSPYKQHIQNINKDATLHPRQSEQDRLDERHQ